MLALAVVMPAFAAGLELPKGAPIDPAYNTGATPTLEKNRAVAENAIAHTTVALARVTKPGFGTEFIDHVEVNNVGLHNIELVLYYKAGGGNNADWGWMVAPFHAKEYARAVARRLMIDAGIDARKERVFVKVWAVTPEARRRPGEDTVRQVTWGYAMYDPEYNEVLWKDIAPNPAHRR